MNLSRIREKFDMRQGVSWLARYWVYVKYPGQDWMNSCFRGDIKILERRFNNHYANRSEGFRADVNDPDVVDSILHASVFKPWAEPKGSAVDCLYWRAFLKTPWGRLPPEEFLGLIMDTFRESRFMHRRKSQCYRKILQSLREEFLRNYVFMIIGLFAKVLYFKAKCLFTR